MEHSFQNELVEYAVPTYIESAVLLRYLAEKVALYFFHLLHRGEMMNEEEICDSFGSIRSFDRVVWASKLL